MKKEEWNSYCSNIQRHLDDLCNHDLTKWECYEKIKEIMRNIKEDLK